MSDTSSSSPAPHGDHAPAHEESHDPTHFHFHKRLYLGVFGALMIGTLITVAVSYFHFGAADSEVGNITVGLIIAAAKAALVILFFMHMKEERSMIYKFMVPTFFFLLVLFGLCVFAINDHIHF